MRGDLPLRLLPRQLWIPLTVALTWISSRHAIDAEELFSGGLATLGLTKDEEVRSLLQEAWRELADAATLGAVSIRGMPDGERAERFLGVDDLRNCRFLSWRKAGDCGQGQGAKSASLVARIERYEPTFSGEWRRLGDPVGRDYVQVVVSREDLCRYAPPPSDREVRLRTSAAAGASALEWLETELATRPPRSQNKTFFLNEMVGRHNVSMTQARGVWGEAVRSRPEWSLPGRPRTAKSGGENRSDI